MISRQNWGTLNKVWRVPGKVMEDRARLRSTPLVSAGFSPHFSASARSGRGAACRVLFLARSALGSGVYIYIYIYIEREREIYVCVYIYISIYPSLALFTLQHGAAGLACSAPRRPYGQFASYERMSRTSYECHRVSI